MDLKKMYGPLPLWGWAIVILGALGIAWYTSRNTGGMIDEPIEVTDTSGVPGVGNVGTPGYVDRGGPVETDGGREIVTNEEWGREAVNEMLRDGYDPTLVDTAIRKYLAAETLTTSENAVIQAALRALGSPPVPLPPPVTGEPSDGGSNGSEEEYPGTPHPPPTLVTAQKDGSSAVIIRFKEPTPKAPGYRIYHQYSSGNVGHTLDNYIKIGGLRPGRTYKFHVRSLNKVGGYGPKSNTATVRL